MHPLRGFFAHPLLASASDNPTSDNPVSAAATATPMPQPTAKPAASSWCQEYQQDLAKRLGVSVTTLQQDRQAAFGDMLAQLVATGKLTQTRANMLKQRMASHPACTGFNGGHFGKSWRPYSHWSWRRGR